MENTFALRTIATQQSTGTGQGLSNAHASKNFKPKNVCV